MMLLVILASAAILYGVGRAYRRMLRRGWLPRTAAKLRRGAIDLARAELMPCPACGGDATGHVLHVPFAISAAKGQRVREFDAALARREWLLLSAFANDLVGEDGVCVEILECPVSKGAAVYRTEARIDFDSDDQTDLVYVLGPAERDTVFRLFEPSKGMRL